MSDRARGRRCERGVPPTVAAARRRGTGEPSYDDDDGGAPGGGRGVPLFGGGAAGGGGGAAGAPAYVEPVVNVARAAIRSGYIEKLGGGTSSMGRQSWKKRFFVLEAVRAAGGRA